MLAKILSAVLLAHCLTFPALADDKSDSKNMELKPSMAQDAPPDASDDNPAADEKSDATSDEKPSAEPEAKPADAKASQPKQTDKKSKDSSSKSDSKAAAAAVKAAEQAQAVPPPVETTEIPYAKALLTAPFHGNWDEATPEEKSVFLEIYAESRSYLQEKWDKATPDERKKILRNHPLISARTLKHHWTSTTPEERAAFLEAHPKTVEKVKKGWDDATPEQRKSLAKEHPYLARKALYHNWAYATPQEKIAYLDAHSTLRTQFKNKWVNATPAQKQWYAQNYAGLSVLSDGKHWAETSTPEREAFLEANPAIMDKLRSDWDKSTPEKRAELVRNWSGWPLKDLTTKTDKKAKAAPAHKKGSPRGKKQAAKPANL